MAQRLIRLAQLTSTPGKPGLYPFSPATCWRWVRTGKFPKPFKLGNNITVWNLGEVEEHIAAQQGAAK